MQTAKQLHYASLIKENRIVIFHTITKYTKDSSWHDDLFQDVALQGWRCFNKFRNQSTFTTWICAIARNIAIGRLRKLEVASKHTGIDWISSDTYREYPTPNINVLSEKDKALFNYRLNGKPFKEVALIMQEPERNLIVRMHRIKQTLSAQIKQSIDNLN